MSREFLEHTFPLIWWIRFFEIKEIKKSVNNTYIRKITKRIERKIELDTLLHV